MKTEVRKSRFLWQFYMNLSIHHIQTTYVQQPQCYHNQAAPAGDGGEAALAGPLQYRFTART